LRGADGRKEFSETGLTFGRESVDYSPSTTEIHMSHYTAVANIIVLVFQDGEEIKAAQIKGPSKEQSAILAKEAVTLLNRARHLNNIKRRYTDAARKIAQAESIAGFEWTEEAHANS
jgi:hypothetical protein